MSLSTETKTAFEYLRSAVNSGTRIIALNGLTSVASRAFVLAKLQAETNKTFVVISNSNKELENWECDLEFFDSKFRIADSKSKENPEILSLPSMESDVYAGISPHAETLEKRALTLWNLARNQPKFVVASAKSLITKTVAPDEMRELGAVLKLDEDFPPEDLIEKLVACGYVREEPIKNVGEFSVRGGILDVWSPTAEHPVRIEFFGDTVDTIREFDAETQLSTRHLKDISIAPMREFAATAQDFVDWAFFASERFSDDRFARNLKDRTDFAAEGEDFSGWEFLLPLSKPRTASIFDYLKDCILVVDEPTIVENTLAEFYKHLDERFAEINGHDEIGLAPDELFLPVGKLRENLNQQKRIELRALGKTAANTDEQFQLIESFENSESPNEGRKPLFLFPSAEKSTDIEIGSRSTRKFHGNVKEFSNELKSQAKAQNINHRNFVMQTLGLAERLEEILRDYEVSLPENSVFVGDLSSGFEIPALDLIIQTETDIFGEITQHEYQKSKTKNQKPKSKTAAFVSDFRDLKAGDFVVHVDHGIGRFEGLQTISAQGSEREFMLLMYAENSKLFVPVERLDLVSRYGSGEAIAPTLDRLGGLGWQKTKAKAKRAMRDMADELLRLYAERKMVQGFAFSADTPWQKEFEDAFPYQLTVDQAAAIEDSKNDMQTAVPMDRLVVGDVGYGKTEVAMRAAFQSRDGRQTGRRFNADDDSRLPAFGNFQTAIFRVSRFNRTAVAFSLAERAERSRRQSRKRRS